jgi:hypothetical protein
LLGETQALRQEYGTPLIPSEQAEQAGQTSAARDALGEEAFALAFAAGQAMTLDDSLDYALTGGDK